MGTRGSSFLNRNDVLPANDLSDFDDRENVTLEMQADMKGKRLHSYTSIKEVMGFLSWNQKSADWKYHKQRA